MLFLPHVSKAELRLTDLQELLAPFPSLRLARPEDNEQILALLAAAPMHAGRLALRYDRSPDWFAHLRGHGRVAAAFVFLYPDGRIGGIAALCPRPGFLQGERVTCAYACELRVAPDYPKDLRRAWHAFYAEVMARAHELDELDRATGLYGAILAGNERASASLTRPDSLVRYTHLADYRTLTIYAGRLVNRAGLWRAEHDRRHDEVAWCTPADRAELETFLAAEHRRKLFGYDFPAELEFRLATWDGLHLADFILVRRQGVLVGCAAPWLSSKSRRLVLERLPLLLRGLAGATRVAGGRDLRPGQALVILYLTHLTIATALGPAQRGAVLRLILAQALLSDQAHRAHALALIDFDADGLTRFLRGFAFQSTRAALFRVHHRDRTAVTDNRHEGAPAFEIALA